MNYNILSMEDLGKLILRLGVSFLLLPHGYEKLERLLTEGGKAGFADPIGIGEVPTLVLAIVAELLCPVMIIVGIKTRLASILPALTMLVAALIVHIDDPWSKMEFPLLYFTGFVAILMIGPGRWSLEHRGTARMR